MRSLISLAGDVPFSLWALAVSVGEKKGSDSGAGGGLNSAGNRASGAGPGASSNRSTTGSGYNGTNSSSSNNGGLNSAGNRASGAGPGASSNRSTSGGGSSSSGSGGNSNSMGGGNGLGGGNSPAGMNNSSLGGSGGNSGLNSAGNRASGAGPGASANRSTSVGGGLNSAGYRGTGAGPGASSNTNTTGASTNNNSPTFSGLNSPRGVGSPVSGGMVNTTSRDADLAQQARTSEIKSMNDMADWGKEVKSVVAAGPGWTEVELNNGLKERRQGDRASRNNNPGNIRDGQWAKSQPGYAGTDGSFAVFSSKEDGIKAIGSLLGKSSYMSKTVEGAISSYAPPNENNTASYVSRVASAIGVSKDTPMSSLTSAQRAAMAKAITGVEGNTGYTTTTTGTDRFSSTYMGGKSSTSAPSTSTPSFGGMNSPRGVSGPQAPSKQQQNDPSGLPPGTYKGQVVGNGIAPTFAGPTAAPAPARAPTSAPAVAPTAAPAPPAPPRQRSLAEKIAAGAVDAGLGMIPGIGTPVSLVNGGLALTGNPTLGDRLVGSFVTGEGAGAGSDSGANRAGSSGRDQFKNTSTVPKESKSFEDRYIKFVDPTKRPTPAERWNYDTPGYS
ncbi:hypothetical protein [Mesorhizobium carmichaelinearum]|uniref:hypothetical protein n=1 Tax=Mesorhizobium carmichaelinearum TaxID=1208188 RepID=UPI001181131C|nr:hypothetical protein [Mesorhizobium carmichaelinearum]